MPQAEYEVWGLRSKATMSNSDRRRRACDAALMPAASPPMTTSRSFAMILLTSNVDDDRCDVHYMKRRFRDY
jgi:hypothetical protein